MNNYDSTNIKHLVRGTVHAEYYYNMLNNARRVNGCFLPSLSETYRNCSKDKESAFFRCVDIAREFAIKWSDSECLMIVGDYGVIGHNTNVFTFGATLMIKHNIEDNFREFRYLIITKTHIYTLFAD